MQDEEEGVDRASAPSSPALSHLGPAGHQCDASDIRPVAGG